MLKSTLITIFFIFASNIVWGAEIYSLLTNKCQLHQGIIVNTEEGELTLLTLEGRSKKLSLKNVSFVVIHNTVDNPIRKIKYDEKLISNLRAVYLKDKRRPLFLGWPVKFVENLVIFYDTRGRAQVFELDKITKIDYVSNVKNQNQLESYEKPSLNLGDEVSHCASAKGVSSSKGIHSTRVYGDKIQISEFFSHIDKGLKRVRSYQERTHVYPKPILYPLKTRMGANILSENVENVYEHNSMYFQWGTGTPYRFQSFTQLGNFSTDVMPTLEPLTMIRSDVKSHLFHATFLGNINALPAGTEYYTNYLYDVLLKGNNANNVTTSSHLNYMAMMGIDYENWSLSFGNFYPIYFVQVKTNLREILASNLSPIFRLVYTEKKWKFRGLFSSIEREASSQATDAQLSIDNSTSVLGIINTFSLKSLYLRAGFDYHIDDELSISFDQIYQTIDYEEQQAGVTGKNFMDAVHLSGQVQLNQRFSDYVNVGVFTRYYNITRDYRFSVDQGNDTDDKFMFGGVFEFIF